MRITQEGDYALRVVLYLYKCGVGKRVEAKAVSEHEKIPLRFLLKLLRKMVAAGIVNSYRGSGGGYAIEKQPSQVSIGEVLESIEGPVCVNKCFADKSLCNLDRADTCEIHRALQTVQNSLLERLYDARFDKILGLDNTAHG